MKRSSQASRPSAPRRGSCADHFRGQIEAAEAEGATRKDMTLRLTLSDVSQLKRDPSLAMADIAFADGVMWYLGVKVEQGGVAASILDRP